MFREQQWKHPITSPSRIRKCLSICCPISKHIILNVEMSQIITESTPLRRFIFIYNSDYFLLFCNLNFERPSGPTILIERKNDSSCFSIKTLPFVTNDNSTSKFPSMSCNINQPSTSIAEKTSQAIEQLYIHTHATERPALKDTFVVRRSLL